MQVKDLHSNCLCEMATKMSCVHLQYREVISALLHNFLPTAIPTSRSAFPATPVLHSTKRHTARMLGFFTANPPTEAPQSQLGRQLEQFIMGTA